MTVRDFAEHLGFNDASVAHWESRGSRSRMRRNTQEVLDIALATAPPEARERFEHALLALATTSDLAI